MSEESTEEQLALALKKNEMLLEKINMLKSAYSSKNDELQSDRVKLTAALAKLKEDREQLQQDAQRWQEYHQKTKELNDRLVAERVKLEAKEELVEQERDKWDEEREQMELERRNALEAHAELRAALAAKTAEAETLRAQLEQLTRALAAQKSGDVVNSTSVSAERVSSEDVRALRAELVAAMRSEVLAPLSARLDRLEQSPSASSASDPARSSPSRLHVAVSLVLLVVALAVPAAVLYSERLM